MNDRPGATSSRLASFWFLYMAAMGIYFPFFALHLRRLGLGEAQIGVVLALLPLAGSLAGPLWGELADRSGDRRRILALLCVGAAVGFAVLGAARGLPAVLLATALFALHHGSVLPLAFAVSLARVPPQRFGRVRVWGTVGFLVAVVSFPPLARRLAGDTDPLRLLFPTFVVLALAAAIAAWRLSEAARPPVRRRLGDFGELLRHRPLASLLVAAFFAFFFMQAPIHLFPLYVEARGGDAAAVSRLWVPMLLVEVPLILFTGAVLRRFDARALIAAGLAAEGLRWSVCAAGAGMAWITAVQVLHGVGVAGVLVGVPLYLERCVAEERRATGQALVAVAGSGLGAGLSNLVGGALMEWFGPTAPYLLSGVGALLAAAAVPVLLPPPRRPAEAEQLLAR